LLATFQWEYLGIQFATLIEAPEYGGGSAADCGARQVSKSFELQLNGDLHVSVLEGALQ
jgi:hypothetical protein